MDIHTILTQQPWRVIENSKFAPAHDALASFAVDDALCHAVGQGLSLAVARAWVHEKTLVLGSQDGRLPALEAGVRFAQAAGWNVIVRNSGGLAVPIDNDVLNLSLLLHEKKNALSIEKGFATMVALLQTMLSPYGILIQTGEIVGSYCPGRYDLSVGGKKFAGVSQRRIRGGVAVQTYVSVGGNNQERAQLIQRFYELASGGDATLYPPINPETLTSLSELAEDKIDHSALLERLKQSVKVNPKVAHSDLHSVEIDLFNTYYSRVADRSQHILSFS